MENPGVFVVLTMFSVPKAFQGHISIIQRNAIRSWLTLNPKPEIVLFGDEVGTKEVAAELGVEHLPNVRCNQYGTPLVNDVFTQVEKSPAPDFRKFEGPAGGFLVKGDETRCPRRISQILDHNWPGHQREFGWGK